MEELKDRGFNKTAVVTLVSDRPFTKGETMKEFINISEKNTQFMGKFLNRQDT